MSRLYTGNDPEPVDIEAAGLRPASPSEILSAALSLEGVETVEWCQTHEANRNIRTAFDTAACDRWWLTAERGGDGPSCSIVSHVIIPLGGVSTETGDDKT